MSKTQMSRSLAILTSLAIITGSMPVSAIGPAAVAMPDFVKALTPPTQLGYVDSFYQGQTEKPVILIQDLHANYGVQKKISGLLEYFQTQLTAGGHPMVLGIEGAWGKMDLSSVRQMAEKPRRAASDFLLKEAEISGMEYFASLSATPVEFYGIDNPEDYFVHRELFRKSLNARLELAGKIDRLRDVVNSAKADGNSELRHLWKLSDDFHAGRIGLDGVSKALNTSLANYGEAEAAIAKAQTAIVNVQKGEQNLYMKNVVVADRSLELLSRLFRQQLSMEEVQYASKQVPEMLTVIQALMPGEDMQVWQNTVRAAIDHYAIALLRNKPMAEHAKELVEQYPHDSPVIVTGGFHTAGIVEALKAKHISYVVIAPVVEGQTGHDERIYLKRMMGLHVTDDQIAGAVVSYAHASTLSLMAKGMVPTGPAEDVIRAENAVEARVDRAFETGQTPKTVAQVVTKAEVNEDILNTIDASAVSNVTDTPNSIKAFFMRQIKKLSFLGLGKRADAPVTKLANGKVVAAGVVTSVLLMNNVAEAGEKAASHPALAKVTSLASSYMATAMDTVNSMGATVAAHPGATIAAVGVAAVVGWFGGTKKGREQALNGLQQAREAINGAA